MRWRTLYRCGGCGKQGAYLLSTAVGGGSIIVTVRCRYCQAFRSAYNYEWDSKSAAEIAAMLTPGPKLGERFTPARSEGDDDA
jgi:hypothetical protein